MTKYVGKHRAPAKWTPRNTIALGIIGAGLISLPNTTPSAQPVSNSYKAPAEILIEPPSPPKKPKPSPPIIENLDLDYFDWVDQGMPGYIPDDGQSKGVSVIEPEIVQIQATCERGPASALGLSTNASEVYETICALFPEITAFGGLRVGDPLDHGSGNAIDAMIDPINGQALADWLIAHADELPIKYVIWQQQIWQGNGWEWMEDRGSPTQNHLDHVHISVY